MERKILFIVEVELIVWACLRQAEVLFYVSDISQKLDALSSCIRDTFDIVFIPSPYNLPFTNFFLIFPCYTIIQMFFHVLRSDILVQAEIELFLWDNSVEIAQTLTV